jgi:hypothetical protein
MRAGTETADGLPCHALAGALTEILCGSHERDGGWPCLQQRRDAWDGVYVVGSYTWQVTNTQ